MQTKLEVVKISLEKEKKKELTQKQKFILELVLMIIVGLLVIVPFALFEYHFFL